MLNGIALRQSSLQTLLMPHPILTRRFSHYFLSGWVVLVLLFSFRIFAPINSATLGSDHAVHILMAYDFHWPDDLYFWGQNRLGSLLPLVSHLLLKIVPLRPVLVVSYVQYGILLIGFLAFASLLKRPVSQLIFALVWFMPLGEFSELLAIGQPYGPQLTCIAVALAIMDWLMNHPEQPEFKRQFLITVATLSLWSSLWISDLSLVVLGLLLLAGLGQLTHQIYRNVDQRNRIRLSLQALGIHRFDLPNILLTSSLGLGFVLYAKAHARVVKKYGLFAKPDEIVENIGRLINAFKNTVSFQVERPFLAVYVLLVLVLFTYLIYLAFSRQTQLSSIPSRWFYLFLATAIFSFILLVLLYWTYKNPNLRYYTFVYLFSWMAMLTYIEGFSSAVASKAYFLLILIIIASSLSLPPRTFFFHAKASTIQQLEPVQSLGKAGFIGDYWTAYLTCTVNPAQMNCTPYDKKGMSPCSATPQNQKKFGSVRCPRCIAKTLDSEAIYLIRDRWLDQFPAEIQQFGQCLVKAGEPQKLGLFEMALYKKRVEPPVSPQSAGSKLSIMSNLQ